MGLQHARHEAAREAAPCLLRAVPRVRGSSAWQRAGQRCQDSRDSPGIGPAQSLPAPGERQGWRLGSGTRWYCLGEWEVGRRGKEQASRKQKGSRQTVAPQHLRVIKGPPKLPEVLFPLQPTCKVGLFFSTGLKPARIKDQFRKGTLGEKAVLTRWGWLSKLETRMYPAGTAPAPAAKC